MSFIPFLNHNSSTRTLFTKCQIAPKLGMVRMDGSCASMPLVALGILRGTNGVGVTQALNILYHSPVSL